MLLTEGFEEYVQDKQMEGYSPNTIKAYQLQFKLLTRHIGDARIEDVTTAMLKEYIRYRSETLKPQSTAHAIKFIRSLFRYLHEEGITNQNVAARIKIPKKAQNVPKYLADESLERLRMSAKDSLDAAVIEFMYSSGVRLGEMQRLNRDDFNFEKRSVLVRGKGNKEREVYFSKRAEILIKMYFESRKDGLDCFISKRNRPYAPMSSHQIRLRMKNVAKRAGVSENIYPHKMRHSYATHLVNRGAPITVIQQFLGHANSETTAIYAHMSGDFRKKAYEHYF